MFQKIEHEFTPWEFSITIGSTLSYLIKRKWFSWRHKHTSTTTAYYVILFKIEFKLIRFRTLHGYKIWKEKQCFKK